MRGKQFFLKCVFFAEQLCRGRLQERLQAAAASRSQVKVVAAPFIRWFKIKGRCTGAHQPLILVSHLHIFHIPPVPYFNVLVFLLRFHVCVRTLPFGQTVAKNPQYFLQMIWDMAAYANHLIRLSNKGNSFFFFTSSYAFEKWKEEKNRICTMADISFLLDPSPSLLQVGSWAPRLRAASCSTKRWSCCSVSPSCSCCRSIDISTRTCCLTCTKVCMSWKQEVSSGWMTLKRPNHNQS